MFAGKMFRLSGGIAALGLILALGARPVAATTYQWNGSSGTAWATAANWSPGTAAPAVGDIAQFASGSAYTNLPTLGANTSVDGLWQTGATAVTIGGPGVALTLIGTNTINGNANTGIELDPGAGAMTISSSVALGGSQQWLNNSSSLLTVSGALNTSGNTLTVATIGSGNATVSGLISGGGGLIKTGAGLLTLSAGAANTYTGGTTISQGTLTLSAAGRAGPGAITLGDANTGANSTELIANSLSDAAPLTNAITVSALGSGPVTIMGSSQNGETRGNMVLNRPTTLAVSQATGGFYFNYNTNGSISGNVGTLTLTSLSTGNLYMGGNNSFAGTVVLPLGPVYTFNSGAFGGTNAGGVAGATNSVNMSGTVTLSMYSSSLTIGDLTGLSTNSIQNGNGSNTLTISSPNSATFAGVIKNNTGTVSLAKSGTGVQTLSGLNTYTGATTILNGTLNLDLSINNNVLPSTNGVTLNYPGTLAVSGGASGTPSPTLGVLTLNGGNVAVGNTGAATALTFSSLNRNGPALMNVNLAAGAGANTLTFSNAPAATGTELGWLTVTDATGTGFGTINGSNNIVRYIPSSTAALTSNSNNASTDFTTNPATDTGAGQYSGGVLTMAAGPAALGSLTINTSTSGGTLDLGGNGGGNALSIASGGVIMTGGNNFTIQDGQFGADSSETDFNLLGSGVLTVSASVGSGIGTLGKGGPGTLVLTASNSFSGAMNIGAGTLQIGPAGILGGGNYGGPIYNSGTFVYAGTASQVLGGPISGNGSLVASGGSLNLTAANTFTGATTVSQGTLTISGGSASLADSNPISIAAGATLNLSGTNNNEFQSGVTGGALNVNGVLAVTSSSANTLYPTTITLTGGTMTSSLSVPTYGAFYVSAARTITANGSGNVISAVNMGIASGATLTLNTPLASDSLTSSTTFFVAGGPLAKAGLGTVILTGSSTYTGATTISGGTLQIGAGSLSGSLSGSSAITDNAALFYDRSDNYGGAVANVISGTGAVTVSGGSLALTGANSFSGVMTVNGAVLNAATLANINTNSAIGKGSASGSPADLVINGGTLQYTSAAAGSTNRLFTVGASGNAALDASGGGMTIGSAGGAIVFANASSPAALILTGNGAGALGAVVGNSGTGPNTTSLTKIGAGSWALNGANTYTGATNVSAGALYLNGSDATGSIAVAGGAALGGSGSATSATATVAGGGIISAGYNNAGSLALDGLTFSSGGTIDVGALTGYANSVALSAGALDPSSTPHSISIAANLGQVGVPNGTYKLIGYSGAIGGAGSSAFTLTSITGIGIRQGYSLVNNPNELDVVISGLSPYWSGNQPDWLTTNAWTLKPGNTPATFITGDADIFDDTALGSTYGGTVLLNSGNVAPASVVFSNTAVAYNVGGSYGITGSASLTVNGAGAVTIVNSNGYTGGTTLASGRLVVNNNNALSSGALTITGGTLDSTVGGITLANSAQNWTGSFAYGGSAPLNMGAGAVTMNASPTVTVGGAGALTVPGVISGGGALTKNGSGTLILTATNNYAGGTTLNNGLLSFVTGGLGSNGNVTFAGNATLQWNGVNTTDISGRLAINNGAAATIDTQGNSVTFASAISTGGSLTKAGSGMLTLSNGGNSFAGITVSAGTLYASAIGAVGNAPIALGDANSGANNIELLGVNGGASPSFGTGTITVPNVSAGSVLIDLGPQNANTQNNFVVNGAATVRGDAAGGGAYFGYYGNGSYTLSGTGALSLTSTAGAALYVTVNGAGFSGPVTFTGNSKIDAWDNTYPFGAGQVTMQNNSSLLLYNVSPTVTDLSDAGATGTSVNLQSYTLTVNSVNGSSYGGAISGTGGLTKTGPGLFALSGPSTYTGITAINGGVLNAATLANQGSASAIGAGSASDTPADLVINGGTLQYTAAGAATTNRVFAIGISGNAALDASGPGSMTLGSGGGSIVFAGTNAATLTLTGNGAGHLGASVNDSNPGTFTTAVVKTGTGTWSLDGYNSYTGPTTISAGGLYLNGGNSTPTVTVAAGATLGGSGSLSSGSATVASGGILDFSQNTGSQFSLTGLTFQGNARVNIGNLSNYQFSGALNVTGNDTLTASGSAGSVTFYLSGSAPVGPGSAVLVNYGGGSIQGTGTSAFSLNTSGLGARVSASLSFPPNAIDVSYAIDHPIWSGAGNGIWTAATQSPKNWVLASDGVTPTDFLPNDAVVFDDTATGTTIVNISGTGNVNPISVNFNNSNLSYTLTGTHGIVGPTSLSINNGGTVTIANSNGYTGGTNFAGGLLNLGNPSALGSGMLTIGGGALDNTSGAAMTLAGNLAQTWTNSFAFVGSSSLNLGGGAVNMSNSPTLFVNAGTLTVGGAISGASDLTKDGNGTLVLAGSNSYSGNTTVSNGLLLLAGQNAYSGGTMINGGTLQLGNGQSGQDGSIAATSGVNNNSTLVYNLAGNQTAAYAINGGGNLVKMGTGQLTLTNAANTFNGGITVSAGTLTTTGIGNVGDNNITLGDANTGANGIELQTTYAGGGTSPFWGAGNITVANAGTGPVLIDLGVQNANFANNFEFDRAVTVQGDAALGGAYFGYYGNNGYTLTGSGALTLKTTGAGRLYVTVDASGYTGPVTLAPNALVVPGPNNANLSFGSGQFAMQNSSTLSLATFSGVDCTVTDLTDAGATGTVVNLGSGTLTVNTVAGSTYGGTILGAGDLLVTGASAFTLSGTNTYTGGTTVEGGTLIAANNEAIEDGTNLSVGTELSLFGTIVPAQAGIPAAASAVAPVPEPGTLALLAAGVALAIGLRWRRRRT